MSPFNPTVNSATGATGSLDGLAYGALSTALVLLAAGLLVVPQLLALRPAHRGWWRCTWPLTAACGSGTARSPPSSCPRCCGRLVGSAPKPGSG
ncbi:hypothetical protein [Cyanobium sp. ATX-6F1]|uniref:hypothetical protein n=1 Tax=Cyanobium sp. ATX-6F1 TaxID=3137388 RepID=UPI0039BE0DCA